MGPIIEVGAILVDDQLNELDRFSLDADYHLELFQGDVVNCNNTTQKKLKETNLSHYEMVKQFVDKLKSWAKSLILVGII